jgi:hypothetical protein
MPGSSRMSVSMRFRGGLSLFHAPCGLVPVLRRFNTSDHTASHFATRVAPEQQNSGNKLSRREMSRNKLPGTMSPLGVDRRFITPQYAGRGRQFCLNSHLSIRRRFAWALTSTFTLYLLPAATGTISQPQFFHSRDFSHDRVTLSESCDQFLNPNSQQWLHQHQRERIALGPIGSALQHVPSCPCVRSSMEWTLVSLAVFKR